MSSPNTTINLPLHQLNGSFRNQPMRFSAQSRVSAPTTTTYTDEKEKASQEKLKKLSSFELMFFNDPTYGFQ
jgi:hypothetical protein